MQQVLLTKFSESEFYQSMQLKIFLLQLHGHCHKHLGGKPWKLGFHDFEIHITAKYFLNYITELEIYVEGFHRSAWNH